MFLAFGVSPFLVVIWFGWWVWVDYRG